MYNAVAMALAAESLKKGKNAQLSDIDTAVECQKLVADGISLNDVLGTETAVAIALLNILAAPPRVFEEPRIKDYARKDIPAGRSG